MSPRAWRVRVNQNSAGNKFVQRIQLDHRVILAIFCNVFYFHPKEYSELLM